MQLQFDGVRHAHQHDVRAGMAVEVIDNRRNRHMRAMIAAHAVYGYGDIQYERLWDWRPAGSRRDINALEQPARP
jgi:hypothetical protein